MTVLCLHLDCHVVIAALELYGSRSADACTGIQRRRSDGDAAHRVIHDQIVGLRIPVKRGREHKSVCIQIRQLVVRASIAGRLRARILRHVVEHWNLKFQCRLLQLRRISLGELRGLAGRRLHIGHILMLIQVASLYIEFL